MRIRGLRSGVFLFVLVLALLLATGLSQAQGPAEREAPASSERSSAITADISPVISYQGRLLDSGSPVTGNRTMVFSLWDTAGPGGLKVWGDETKTVSVSNGVFAVTLGSTVALDVNEFDRALWLQVVVAGTTLPRQRLMGSPYAMSLAPEADITGNVIAGWSVLRVQNTGAGVGLLLSTTTGAGLDVDATSGNAIFATTSSGGTAVYADSAGNDGVYGQSNDSGSAGKAGVYGRATGGWYYGVLGRDGSGADSGYGLRTRGYPNIADPNGDAGINDDLYVNGTCTGCAVAYTGLNLGAETLAPGDVVVIDAIDKNANPLLTGQRPLLLVRKMKPGDTAGSLLAVVLEGQPPKADTGIANNGTTTDRILGGGYLSVATRGALARLKVDALGAAIGLGDALTATATGAAVKARPVVVQGVELYGAGTVLGRALEPMADGTGEIWVLLSGQ